MIFRAYDIRGKVDKELTPELAEKIGQALGSEMQKFPEIIVGRDNRPSSVGLASALMRGIRAAGVNTMDIGEVATPILYHASVKHNSSPAVMITGSHLPPDQNGFKITQGTTPFFGDSVQRLRQRIEAHDFISGQGEHREEEFAALKYMRDLSDRFTFREKGFKIVVDAGNGMASTYAPALLRHMGHNVIELYCVSDGTYPNHPADPFEEENLHDLKEKVIAEKADFGLAFDGDADRVGVVDGAGNFHPTDRAMIPLVRSILKREKGATIITDPLTSKILIDEIRNCGGVPLIYKSGHSYIKSKMKETKSPFALETSGHVFINDFYYGYDDGIYTALRLVDVLAKGGESFTEMMAKVPRLHTTPQYRPVCPDDRKAEVIEAVHQHYKDHDLSTVDGVRVTLPEGWFILRASNTEPKLSLRFEADNEIALNGMVSEVRNLLAGFQVKF